MLFARARDERAYAADHSDLADVIWRSLRHLGEISKQTLASEYIVKVWHNF
eukprot:COSAG02_NODE_3975_length_5965_cov_5.092226_6_plen_51_part_00